MIQRMIVEGIPVSQRDRDLYGTYIYGENFTYNNSNRLTHLVMNPPEDDKPDEDDWSDPRHTRRQDGTYIRVYAESVNIYDGHPKCGGRLVGKIGEGIYKPFMINPVDLWVNDGAHVVIRVTPAVDDKALWMFKNKSMMLNSEAVNYQGWWGSGSGVV